MNNNDEYKYYKNNKSIISKYYENKLILNSNFTIELYHNWN
jgi:hypothetical protein